jgi:DNA-binding response OmpR family regulator/HPt (histidine-containing phosphotransfer) domain-containing protein
MADELDQEFVSESLEMIESAQDRLLDMEKASTEETLEIQRTVLRVLHTLKGACGMFGLNDLEKGFHFFEDVFIRAKNRNNLTTQHIDYILKGLDATKESLLNKKPFSYELTEPQEETSAPLESRLHRRSHLKIEKRDKPLVYVLEDEKEIREFIQKKIESLGYDCKSYEDPTNAIKDIASDHPDLIVTDLNMPKIGGMEFISKVYPLFPQLPVIILSAYVTKDICIESLSFGAAGIIEKPFKSDQLLSMVKLNVNRYQSYKLLGRSIRYMQYQFSDLDRYLSDQGLDSIRETLRYEMQQIMIEKRKMDKMEFDR